MYDGIDRLLVGNKEFAQNREEYKSLADGQDPKYIVIVCSDSRCDPETICNQKPGVIFSIRIAGALLGDESIASIQFALEAFKNVESILILGHTKCGAVTAAQKRLNDIIQNGGKSDRIDGALGRMVDRICKNISQDSNRNMIDLDNAILDNTIEQCRVLTRDPIVTELLEKRGIPVKYGIYDIKTLKIGEIKEFNYMQNKTTEQAKRKNRA